MTAVTISHVIGTPSKTYTVTIFAAKVQQIDKKSVTFIPKRVRKASWKKTNENTGTIAHIKKFRDSCKVGKKYSVSGLITKESSNQSRVTAYDAIMDLQKMIKYGGVSSLVWGGETIGGIVDMLTFEERGETFEDISTTTSNSELSGSNVVVEVSSADGFMVGDDVVIADSSNSEITTINTILSSPDGLLLDLTNSYDVGATVTLAPYDQKARVYKINLDYLKCEEQ